jgi:hypothetical protein
MIEVLNSHTSYKLVNRNSVVVERMKIDKSWSFHRNETIVVEEKVSQRNFGWGAGV